jgi:prevent-host-death family protein
MDVGIRALRDSLSRYLDEVKAGKTVTVTDNGKPIARIVPIQEMSPLERLIAEGRARPPLRPKRPAPEPIQGVPGGISDLVIEERR